MKATPQCIHHRRVETPRCIHHWGVVLLILRSIQQQRSIYWKIPSPWGGKYQPMSFGGKNMKSGREKEGKCKRKMKKGEEKGRSGKE